jgi:hypothetical protein
MSAQFRGRAGTPVAARQPPSPLIRFRAAVRLSGQEADAYTKLPATPYDTFRGDSARVDR